MTDEVRTLEQPTPMGLIQFALQKDLDIDKLKELIGMQRDSEDRHARMLFGEALANAQAEITRIVPDCKNEQTRSRYASFAALDRAIRPVYTNYGFSLSFSVESQTEAEMVMVCDVSHRAGHTRQYKLPIPRDGKGAKGNDVMTKTHATGSAASYARRYLLGMIFNLAIGEDKDGNDDGPMSEAREQMDKCQNKEELEVCYKMLFQQARTTKNPQLMGGIVAYYDVRRGQLS